MITKSLRTAFIVPVLGAQVVACASSPDSISAAYVSPVAYQSWSCPQLIEENNRLVSEVHRVSGKQRETANTDAVLMGVGMVLFWPALLGLSMKRDQSDQLARLKGEHDAVSQMIRSRQCQQMPNNTAAGN